MLKFIAALLFAQVLLAAPMPKKKVNGAAITDAALDALSTAGDASDVFELTSALGEEVIEGTILAVAAGIPRRR